MKKYFFFLIALFIVFSPFQAQAIDQRCWTKSDCVKQRSKSFQQMDQKPEDGFVHNTETIQACGAEKTVDNKTEELGFCLPVGMTETKISFGGTQKFSDVADFIRYMYRYGIMIAGIISVIMIIVAGFQWAVSGGNPSNIQAAQKRIQGAIIGLTIALLSYSILNFINPNLVNFRLPQIWLINTVNLAPAYCDNKEIATNKLSLLIDKSKSNETRLSSSDIGKKFREAKFDTDPANAKCGNQYFIDGFGGLYCTGLSCGAGTGQVCDLSVNECRPGVMVGRITNSTITDTQAGIVGSISDLFLGKWVWEDVIDSIGQKGWVVNETLPALSLVSICEGDDSFSKIVSSQRSGDMKFNDAKREQDYLLPISGNVEEIITEATTKCEDEGGLRGFAVLAMMHELKSVSGGGTEMHLLGLSKKTNKAIDLGDGGYIIDKNNFQRVLSSPGVDEYLISSDEIRKGVRMDIDAGDVYNNENNADADRYYSEKFFVSTP